MFLSPLSCIEQKLTTHFQFSERSPTPNVTVYYRSRTSCTYEEDCVSYCSLSVKRALYQVLSGVECSGSCVLSS